MAWKTIRKQSRRPSSQVRKRLLLEPLEQRMLLAADSGALVGFRLAAADPVTLQPITAIRVGEEFALVAYVRDLRSQPQGVFSAYLDINFPGAQFEVSGPIRYLGGFTNATSGEVGVGIVDEVGGFSENTRPPGGAEQILAAIPFIPRQAGEFKFTADAADLAIGHEVLVYGSNSIVSPTTMQFAPVTTEVAPRSDTVTHLHASDDEFFVRSANTQVFDVLANDVSPAPSSMTIFRVDDTDASGSVAISSDRRHVNYTPPANFTGLDTFHYSVVDQSGESATGSVTVHVENGTVLDKKAHFQIITADRTGRPISAINEGDDFLLQMVVSDTRSDPQGLFAAYADVAFAPHLARVTGPLEFPGIFSNGVAGNTASAGLIDEVGAFASRLAPQGDGSFLLFQVPMKALQTGKAVFQTGPADEMPDHQSLLFGENVPLDPNAIAYEQTELEIRPAVIVVDDSFDLPSASGPTLFNVLANDQATSTSPLTITQIDTTGLRGTVSVAADGRSLTYLPALDSRGTEQFRYTAANATGSASAQVTVHLQPLAPLDDLLQIRLSAVDSAGNPLTTVNAGDAFTIQARVRDLRTLGTNRGVYAAYFDLLYDAGRAGVIPAEANARGFDVTFGPEFQNGQAGSGAIAGVLNEIGAFQTSQVAAGNEEQLLFSAQFRANAGQAAADRFSAQEDTAAEFAVLANDLPNLGAIQFQPDPADVSPQSDVLLFQPEEPIPPSGIRYLSTSVNVTGGAIQIVSVSPSRRGGTVTIVNDGHAVRYTPPANYFGPDEFSYSLGAGNDTAVQVNVAPANDAPGAASDRYVAGHQQPLQVSAAAGVLGNDTDVDRDSLQAQLVTPTAHGRLQFNADGSFVYTPNEGFFGSDRFVYRSFDGTLSSPDTEVQIEVTPPAVRVRLDVTDTTGAPLTTVRTGDTFVLHALVQDMRDGTRSDRGVGAVYMDVAFDPAQAQAQADSTNPLGFDVDFGSNYQNVLTGNIRTPGLVDDVGALQTAFSPLGREEAEVFSLTFQIAGPQVVNDSYRVSKHSNINVFDVLLNEQGQSIPVEFRARESGNSPFSDIVLYAPAQAIHGADVSFGSTVVQVRNSSTLVLDSIGSSSAGGVTSIDPLGRGIRYTPPANFVGQDTFTYTVRDPQGTRRTATVTVEVVDSWSNEHLTNDANSDSFVTTNDVLQIINDLNLHGSRQLAGEHQGSAFYDVNRDGFATAIDALILINVLSQSLNAASEGESASDGVGRPAPNIGTVNGPASDELGQVDHASLTDPLADRRADDVLELEAMIAEDRLATELGNGIPLGAAVATSRMERLEPSRGGAARGARIGNRTDGVRPQVPPRVMPGDPGGPSRHESHSSDLRRHRSSKVATLVDELIDDDDLQRLAEGIADSYARD